MRIDSHAHGSTANLTGSPGDYIARCGQDGIDGIVLIADPDPLFAAKERLGSFVIAVPIIDMDQAGPDEVHGLFDRGAEGIKFFLPKHAYGDERYFPLYEAIKERDGVAVFHTGYVMHDADYSPRYQVKLDDMRAGHIDTIERYVPHLKVLMGHFGNPYWEECWKIMWEPSTITMSDAMTVLFWWLREFVDAVYADMSIQQVDGPTEWLTPGMRKNVIARATNVVKAIENPDQFVDLRKSFNAGIDTMMAVQAINTIDPFYCVVSCNDNYLTLTPEIVIVTTIKGCEIIKNIGYDIWDDYMFHTEEITQLDAITLHPERRQSKTLRECCAKCVAPGFRIYWSGRCPQSTVQTEVYTWLLRTFSRYRHQVRHMSDASHCLMQLKPEESCIVQSDAPRGVVSKVLPDSDMPVTS